MNIVKIMEIIVFSTYGYSFETWSRSGTLNRELALYKKLHENFGLNFTFITYGDYKDLDFDIEIKGSKVVPIYSLMKYNKNRIFRYINSFKIPFIIRHLIKNGEVLHQHQLLGSWVPIICKVLYRKKLLIRTGYDMYEFSKQQKKSILIKLLYKILTRFTFAFSDIYTVTSSSDKNLFKKNKKIKLRPNWVSKTSLNEFNNRFNNRLLSVGRLEDQKNYEYLIKEFKNTKDELIIDIYGSGQNHNNLLKLANKLNVNINIYKNLKHDELLKIYPNYKFYITSSLYEGNPKTVLEAMSSGCIVLASNIPNHAEIIENEHNGYLYDLKENNLFNLFSQIKADNNLNKISRKAFVETAEKNSLKLLTSKTYEDYLSLVK